MTSRAMAVRLVVLSACLLGTSAVGARAMRPELPVLREPLGSLAMDVGNWTGHDAPAFGTDILQVLGVDEYVHRVYVAGGEPLSLYVGYYRSQRHGDTIHSPQNCLPGAGWLPVSTSRLSLDVGRMEPITVNRLLIQKGTDRQVVLYWYQSQGRVVASEYWSKAYLVYDAVRRHRSDAAMVRIISPILPGDAGEKDAEQRAIAFIQAVFADLDALLPM